MIEHLWYKKAMESNPHDIKKLPGTVVVLSDNGVSIVFLDEAAYTVYKVQPKFFTQNEIGMLFVMDGNYAPIFQQYDLLTIKMPFYRNEPVSDVIKFNQHKLLLRSELDKRRIRHGDITVPNIRVVNDVPILLDWAESRVAGDPRPDKRIEGDEYWMNRTWEELCHRQQ
jgi:hypothetical protein